MKHLVFVVLICLIIAEFTKTESQINLSKTNHVMKLNTGIVTDKLEETKEF